MFRFCIWSLFSCKYCRFSLTMVEEVWWMGKASTLIEVIERTLQWCQMMKLCKVRIFLKIANNPIQKALKKNEWRYTRLIMFWWNSFIFLVDEEDVDGVSVGGMDVSDIEDEEHDGMSMASHQTGGHASQRSYNSQGSLQPRPPPRYPHQPSPPKQHFSQSQVRNVASHGK